MKNPESVEQYAAVEADWLLHQLYRRTKGDSIISMAALAVALCCLARGRQMAPTEVHELVTLVNNDLEAAYGDVRSMH